MKKSFILLFGILFAALSSASVFADTINFNFNSPTGTANQFSGSGAFTVSETSPNVYQILDVTGTIVEGSNVGSASTVTIDSLLAAGTMGNNDNLLYYPISSHSNKAFDGRGVAFLLSDGSSVRLYNNNNENLIESAAYGHSSFSENSVITLTPVASTPEPGTLLLFGTGALGFAGVIRRRRLA